MDATFWHERWREKSIGFHNAEVNPLLVRYFSSLALSPGSRVFLPLCGKTRDIAWLLGQGFRVAGVELSEIAVSELFDELGVVPEREAVGELMCFRVDGLAIFQGDIFDLDRETLGAVEAIYDRAALVALPESMRARYTQHLIQMSDAAPQLLINYDYDQSRMPGPPFSISDNELRRHYAGHYRLKSLYNEELEGGLKGQCPAREKVWLLQNT